jgi:ribosomal protein S13
MLSFFLSPSNIKLNVFQVLVRIPNIGKNKINFICKQIGVFKTTSWQSLTDLQLQKLSFWFEETFTGKHAVGVSFKKAQKDYIIYLKSLRNFRSYRLLKGLPARGQHTKNNAKTARKAHKLCKTTLRYI